MIAAINGIIQSGKSIGGGGATDPYFSNVILLIQPGNAISTNPATYKDDSSYNRTVTPYPVGGDTADIVTDSGSLSGKSIQFAPGQSQYALISHDNLFNFGSDLFTIELTFTPTESSSSTMLIAKSRDLAKEVSWSILITTTGSVSFVYHYGYGYSDRQIITASYACAVGEKHVLGFRRIRNPDALLNDIIEIYANNTLILSEVLTNNTMYDSDSSTPVAIGRLFDAPGFDSFAVGNMNQIRITRGIARDLTAAATTPFPIG